MKCSGCFLAFFLSFFLGSSHEAVVFRFANIYGDHMVLQQAPSKATIWGFGEVGQDVLLTARKGEYQARIKKGPNNTGIWSVTLRPQRYGGPNVIEASSIVNAKRVTATLKNVMFGDVWMCAGQSNMEMAVRTTNNGQIAINQSKTYSNIRLFTAEWSYSQTPLSELNGTRQPWSVASPETVGGKGNTREAYFSATCWYYGIHLYDKLKYPIGLVASSWYGSPIEYWSSPDALQKCNTTEDISKIEEFCTFKLPGTDKNAKVKPSFLWNAMMHPFTKMTIYGVIWYQGETNAFMGFYPYNCIFPAMIDDWRAKWFEGTQRNTDKLFPFGFVQLSSYVPENKTKEPKYPPLRWDQTARYGYAPNDRQKRVFMAVAMDLGNPYSPFTSAHPTNKNDVGKRLALASLGVAYNKSEYFTGPLVSEIVIVNFKKSLKIGFKNVTGNIEVRSRDGFEVLCQGKTKWIRARIVKEFAKAVKIRAARICKFEAVRYAWDDYPCDMKMCAIYSGKLPSPPFIKYGPFEKI